MTDNEISTNAWSPADTATLYGIDRWGKGFVTVDDQGHVRICPDGSEGPWASLTTVIEAISARDIALPVLLRFSNLIEKRLDQLVGAFTTAIDERLLRDIFTREAIADALGVTQDNFEFSLVTGSARRAWQAAAFSAGGSGRLPKLGVTPGCHLHCSDIAERFLGVQCKSS